MVEIHREKRWMSTEIYRTTAASHGNFIAGEMIASHSSLKKSDQMNG
jgi:hypothetical protein